MELFLVIFITYNLKNPNLLSYDFFQDNEWMFCTQTHMNISLTWG